MISTPHILLRCFFSLCSRLKKGKLLMTQQCLSLTVHIEVLVSVQTASCFLLPSVKILVYCRLRFLTFFFPFFCSAASFCCCEGRPPHRSSSRCLGAAEIMTCALFYKTPSGANRIASVGSPADPLIDCFDQSRR